MIDWTPVVAGLVSCAGVPEYKVEDDGLVRWRGIVTLNGGQWPAIPCPVEARPVAAVTLLYWDWAAADRAIHLGSTGNSHVYIANIAGASWANGRQINLHPLTYQGPVPPAPPAPTHTLANVRTGISNALKTLLGLRVYDFPSDRVEPPAAVLSLPETPYDVTLDGRNDAWTFPLWVLVAKADDKASYSEMTTYLEAEGARSIRAALEADRTLGGACDSLAVLRARPLFATVAGTEFLAVEFTLEVYT